MQNACTNQRLMTPLLSLSLFVYRNSRPHQCRHLAPSSPSLSLALSLALQPVGLAPPLRRSHPPTGMVAVRPSQPTGPTSTLSTTRHSIRAPTNSMLLSIPVAKHRPTNITRPVDMHPLIRLPATTRAPSSTRTTTPTVAADTTSSTTAGPRTNGTGMTLPTRPPQLRFVWDDIDDIFG